MKKIFLSMLAIAAMAATANAQLWFGGSLGFSHEGGVIKTKEADTDKPSVNSFSFSPMVGFELNEKLSVGGKLDFTNKSTKQTVGDTDTKRSESTFGITPFARYTFVEFNKFGLLAEAGIPVAFSSSKHDNGSKTVKGDPETSIGLYVRPMLTYSLNDNFQLECGLNFLSFNAKHSVIKSKDDSNNKNITNTFDFGVDSRNVATVGFVTIGFIYKL
ncbi:MAG: outer membrane beta-barrel protein [Bacteroidales bacterium]|nr:outer membrane beta-barrel protein [Bacteroidales bacterium]